MRLFNVTLTFCAALLLTVGCHPTKPYERHKEIAYTKDGAVRVDGYFYNTEFMNAIVADLDACYAKKQP